MRQNVIHLDSYKINKIETQAKMQCLQRLEESKNKITDTKLQVESFKTYLDNMVRFGYINKDFCHDLKNQIDSIYMMSID